METTKQIFEKAKKLSNGMPLGIIFYWKFFDNVLEPQTVNISFKKEMRSLNTMKMAENLEGFQFWAISEEGEKFLKDNKVVLGQAFYNTFAPLTNATMT